LSAHPGGALVVAIDGPSGSGKSSVSREVARRLRLAYLDTGAMYRAAAWWCLHQGLELTDRVSVAEAVRTMSLRMVLDPAAPAIEVGGYQVAEEIRSTEISSVVSTVATNLEVRAELGRRQRDLIDAEREPGGASGGRGVVAEGRDITTVIAPDAEVRILLTANEGARLARRALEVHGSADEASVDAIRDQVLRRDAQDSTVVEFQTAADGVVTVDSSALDYGQTVLAVLKVVEAWRGRTT
jgi:cytidylate kinase